MQIALCDDTADILDSLKSYLRNYCFNKQIQVTIDFFSSGEDLLSRNKQYDILFMDIFMDGIKGTEAVEHYKQSKNGLVVFITTSTDFALEAFGLGAVHYLVKPLTQDAVDEAMNRCLANVELRLKLSKFIEVKTSKGMVSIPINSIIYMEVFNRTSIIHTKTGDYKTNSSLDSLFETVDESSFMRAQRSYAVNMNFIEKTFHDRIVIKGNIEIVLSRKNRDKLRQQYQQFLYALARSGEL